MKKTGPPPMLESLRLLVDYVDELEEEIWRLKVAAGEIAPHEGFVGTDMPTVNRLLEHD